MRLVIDFTGAQGASRHRGIGRYSTSFAKALARNRGPHEVIISISLRFPETIEAIREEFAGILPAENIATWDAPGPYHALIKDHEERRTVAAIIREASLANLQPDLVLISSLFEGYQEDIVATVGRFEQSIPVATMCYDLIPLLNREKYLDVNPLYAKYYASQIAELSRSNLLLAISESSRREAVQHLGMRPDAVINVKAASDDRFFKADIPSTEANALLSRHSIGKPFVMYSGAADDRKNHRRLIEAFAQLPGDIRSQHQLVFVGELRPDQRQSFEWQAKKCGLDQGHLVIVGWISDREMNQFYNLAKVFAFPSWHEGFGLPALEAMRCGKAVVASNTSSLPEVIGRGDALFDPFDVRSIRDKLQQVLIDEVFRRQLEDHASEQVRKFSWDSSAEIAWAAFENVAAKHSEVRRDATPLQRAIDQIGARTADVESLPASAVALTRSFLQQRRRQLLIDISILVQHDARSGIQRVVKSILANWLASPPHDFDVKPVHAAHGASRYRYVESVRLEGGTIAFDRSLGPGGHVVDAQAGDVLVILDLHYIPPGPLRSTVQDLRHRGVKTWAVVYDLLPVLLPEGYFLAGVARMHGEWLKMVASLDGAICISRSVADELHRWVSEHSARRFGTLDIDWFHLGGDLGEGPQERELEIPETELLKAVSLGPSFLMVGTIEPRKGHREALDAFEELWAAGETAKLVIVGRPGWHIEPLLARLRAHPLLGKQLFVLDDAEDILLNRLYQSCTCLLAASEAEGFGLPLIEAAKAGLPVLARDIPVFREVAGDHAIYFPAAGGPSGLAEAVRGWLDAHTNGRVPRSEGMPRLSWRESSEMLLGSILGRKPHYRSFKSTVA